MTVSQLPKVGERSPRQRGHALSLFGSKFVDESSGVHERRIAFCYPSGNSVPRVPSDSILLNNNPMENNEIRRANLSDLIDSVGSIRALADRVGTAPNYLSEIKNRERNMGNRLARKIEEAMGLAIGWMDTAHNEQNLVEPVAYISASSPEDLAEKLAEKGNEDIMKIIQLLLANKDKISGS